MAASTRWYNEAQKAFCGEAEAEERGRRPAGQAQDRFPFLWQVDSRFPPFARGQARE